MSIQALTWVIEECDATLGSRCLMFAIANHADQDGRRCFASVKTLAKESRLTRKATQSALRRLEGEDLIEAVGTSQYDTTIYDIKAMQKGSNAGGVETTPGEDDDQGGAKLTTENGASTTPEPSTEPSEETDESVAVRAVFDYWVVVMQLDKARTQLTPGRRKKIVARLKEGYTVEDMQTAIYGCWSSDYHMKRGESAGREGPVYNGLAELILRSGDKLEWFRGMGEAALRRTPAQALPAGIPLA